MHRIEESATRRFLIARAGEDQVALDMRQLRGVTSDLNLLEPLGVGALRGLRGVKNIRGSIVPVIDVSEARGGIPSRAAVETRLALLVGGSARRLWGLWLDEVIGVREIPAGEVSVPRLREGGGAVAFLHFDDECIPVIDPVELSERGFAAA